jgi:imidazolonepropionase-like amidohydrolase
MTEPANEPASTEELRARIAVERELLGETVAELADRVDVPARAKAETRRVVEEARVKGTEVLAQARDQGRSAVQKVKAIGAEPDRRPLLAVVAAIGAVVGLLVLRGRRRR